MKIRGKEVKFLRTVKATSEIAKLCPDQDIERIGELFSGTLPTTLETGAKIAHYLNEGYEMNKHFEDPDYEPNIISVEEIMYLTDSVYTELMQAALNSMNNGAEVTVETQKSKKKVKNQE